MTDMKWDLDTWHNTIRGATISIAGEVPVVGFAVSTALSFFWPSDQAHSADIWKKIEKQTAVMIDKAILAQELRDRRADLRTLKRVMAVYCSSKGRNKTSYLDQGLIKAEDIFNHIEESSHTVHLVPMAAATSYLYFILLRERALFAADLYDVPERQQWLDNLYDQMDRFQLFFHKTFPKWTAWRFRQIRQKADGKPDPFFGHVTVEAEDRKPETKLKFNYRKFAPQQLLLGYYQLFERLGDSAEEMMKTRALVEFASAVSVFWDARHLMPPNPKRRKAPPPLLPHLKRLYVGPFSCATLGQERFDDNLDMRVDGKWMVNRAHAVGHIAEIKVRAGVIVDALQVIYDKRGTRFVGNEKGGRLHRVKMPKGTHICSLRLMYKHPFLHEIAFGLSNGKTAGPFGNSKKLRGKVVDLRPSSAFALSGISLRDYRSKWFTGLSACHFVFVYQPPPKPKTAPPATRKAAAGARP